MTTDQGSTEGGPRHDSHRIDHLQLPAHVNLWLHGSWQPGWLIACENQPSGWCGLVQYRNEHQAETTEWLPAEQIAPRPNP
jgi:hypothetical protein